MVERACDEADVPRAWARNESLWALLAGESGSSPIKLKVGAQNKTSTAYGIFQFLDGTWAGKPYSKTSDPYKQFVNGLIYIKNRYKTPERAYQFWVGNSPHWY